VGHRHSSAELGSPRGIFRADRRTLASNAIYKIATPSLADDPCSKEIRSRIAARRGVELQTVQPSRSLVASAFQMAIRVYQAFLSPLLFSSCRYYPTCSQYAYDAIELHGAARGVWLALKRLLRCHPFSRGGFDPVPIANPSAPPVTIHRSGAQQSAIYQKWAATQERAANQE